jgi:hypothetical protein
MVGWVSGLEDVDEQFYVDVCNVLMKVLRA